jgi:hypothetical protein
MSMCMCTRREQVQSNGGKDQATSKKAREQRPMMPFQFSSSTTPHSPQGLGLCVWVLGAHDTCVDPYMSEGMNELKRRIFMVTDSRSIYQLPFFSCEMLQFHLAANFKIHWNVCPQLLLSSLSLAFQRGQLLDVGLQLV